MQKKRDLIKLVRDNQLMSAEDLADIIRSAKEKGVEVEEILSKKINSEEIAKIEAKECGLPYENLTEMEIKSDTLNLISADVAANYKIICFERYRDEIKVGLTDPNNFKAMEAVDFLAKEEKLRATYFLISDKSFQTAYKQYKSLSKELTSALEDRKAETDDTEKGEGMQAFDEASKSAPVAKIVSVIIRHAIDGGASDIHIEPLKNESRTRYRIDGILHTSLVLPKNVHRAIVARIKVMANLKLDETRIPQDGRFKLNVNDRPIDFRVSTLPLVGVEKVVMRVLDTSKGPPKLVDLGIQGAQYEVISKNIKKTEGLLLVTGPTGSGKSTTIFSILDILNKEGVNIATLEDPVEYEMKGVNQSQIRPEVGYTFASGLRSFLRQDPDIILVGEIRDEETAELATHAALTGHYVLSTLHTTNAPSTVTRLADMKIEPFLIGTTLHTIITQRLVRKICEHCKEEIPVPEQVRAEALSHIQHISVDYIKTLVSDYEPAKARFYKGKGCNRCGNSGHAGRMSIVEVLDINDKLKDVIKGGKKFLSIDEIKKTQNYISAQQDGIIKVLQGYTTLEEVYRVMKD